jgi:starch synthase
MHVFLLKRGQILLNLQSLIKERLSMQKRILIVSQEVSPYISNEGIADGVLNLAKIVKKNPGVEVRLMMPKYGCVNERRHQLHEVIRLSGVNIVVNDIDQPLIVKVASVPQARLQVYFIDNDEYFQKKLVLHEKNNTLVKDNDERMMFFCRGVLETLQMLGWSPNIIHCHGWFTSLIPLYLKTIYANHPVFAPTNIISSFYKKSLKGSLDKKLIDKIQFDGIDKSMIEGLVKPNAENLHKIAARFSDGIIFEDKNVNAAINEYATQEGRPILEVEAEEAQEHYKFYQNFFSEALV